jgi:arabinogalactan endo-1,4-beta-galactosidase
MVGINIINLLNKKSFAFIIIVLIFYSCKKEVLHNDNSRMTDNEFITAVDISSYPEIALTNQTFYNLDGNKQNFLSILKENGVNTIRLRLWVDSVDNHSGFNEVRAFAETLRNRGFKIWLTLHYSNTWADPSAQQIPSLWQYLDFDILKDSVYTYTERVVNELKPNYIQIGNEINSGILHPHGNNSNNYDQFLDLLQEGCSAVRNNSLDCKIILHFAGFENADFFFNQLKTIDYDIIGLSFYTIWHGKSMEKLRTSMQNLSLSHDKQIIIAETAYPFTLEWNDWTDNIVGLNEQLILPDYPATPDGQRRYIRALKELTQGLEKGIGFCYWGAELVAWKGEQATDASTWENQALFDFNNKALPVFNEFK